jgi:hypothetical protein
MNDSNPNEEIIETATQLTIKGPNNTQVEFKNVLGEFKIEFSDGVHGVTFYPHETQIIKRFLEQFHL